MAIEEYRRAETLYHEGKYEEALRLYRSLAETSPDNGELFVFVGSMYSRGKGTPVDFDEARRWFERAANLGSVDGQFCLGRLALKRERYQEARMWFEQAAEQNYPPAIYFLGHLYDSGCGVPRDQGKATRFFEEAAKEGHLYAQGRLARMFLGGARGVSGIPKGLLLAFLTVKNAIKEYVADPYGVRLRV